ncbi:hypothetical protein WJX72_000270 [[Myrmecia] bisecta]|uniref:Uncharacterized protein n=1 Tax=[Myrmecia] bisecta TaxID=41462 RepID=A0AAW1PVT3_9CHLO
MAGLVHEQESAKVLGTRPMARSHANLALALLALLCAAGLTSVGGAPTTNPLLASKIRRAPAPAPGPSLARKGFAPAPGLYAADDCINQCEQNLSDSLAALATVNAAEGTPATDLGITDVLKYCQANCLAEAAAAAPSPDDCASQCTQSLELSALTFEEKRFEVAALHGSHSNN